MGVQTGAWTVRNAVVVIALAVTLAVLVWVRLLGPGGALSSGSAHAHVTVLAPTPIRGDLAGVRSNRPGLRVLFVGNSLTYFNQMTAMVEELAEHDPGAPPLFTAEYAPPGAALERSVLDVRLSRLIAAERWDVVVLQEQSWIPSSAWYRRRHMFPAARALDAMARQRGARTILFMTWGYTGGDPDLPRDSYSAMQSRVASGYTELSARLHARVAPVGLAWRRAVKVTPGPQLWAADGHHPSRAGSYLAACVFYARLAHRDPRRSTFTAGLPPPDARGFQRIATSLVRHVRHRH